MLQNINRLGKSWVGRVVVTVLFGFLIVSFAIWGIGDIFRGGVRTQVATVGNVDVTAEAYRQAYQTEYQNLIRRARQSITPDQARAFGLDRQVLGRLVTEAALDQRAASLGLAVPDQVVVAAIQADPSFRGASGQFDRNAFADVLRSAGLTEAQYVRDQKAVATRLQIAEAVTGALPVPAAMRDAVHRYTTERRAAEYVVLPPAAAGEIPAPTEADLQAFFDERKALYRAPEYRALNLLVLDAAALARPDAVSEADIRATYERVKDTRFGTPERRSLQQIVFPSAEEAAAASARIKAGTPFATIATERGIDDATLNLGTVARSDVLDPATAEAAFALPAESVSDPIVSRFGAVLVRVGAVQPGSVKPFEEVAPEIRTEIAATRAGAEIQAAHDAIEDQRAAARPLSAIAAERKLSMQAIPAVDRQGRDKAGATVALPDAQNVLAAAYRGDVGADLEALRLPGGGYVWIDVAGIEPARDRTLAEVKDRVAEEWRADAVATRLAERAKGLRERLDAGEPLAKLAAEANLTVETAADIGRTTVSGALTRAVVTRLFATPVGKAADVAADDAGRVLLKVTGASVPPLVTTTQQAAQVEEQVRSALADDILGEYFRQIEAEIGVRTYPDAVRRAVGGES